MESIGMQKCGECKKRLKWNQIYNSLSLSYRPISCNHCGTKYKITLASRILTGLLIAIPIVGVLTPFAINQSFTIPFTITVALIYALHILLILPLKYDYLQH
jgi:CXXC-20-CXXC protein